MSTATTVFVVDDDQSVREALHSLMRSVGHAVETYAGADAFLQRLKQAVVGPACLVLDVRMPGMGGLELQRELAGLRDALPIIFITGHGDIPMTVRAMRAGAVEFLPKPFREQDLLEAIDQALARSRERHEARHAVAELRARFDSLSPREREVLGLVAEGFSNKLAARTTAS